MIIRNINITVAVLSILLYLFSLDISSAISAVIILIMIFTEFSLYKNFKINPNETQPEQILEKRSSEDVQYANYSVFESKVYKAAYFVFTATYIFMILIDLVQTFNLVSLLCI